MKKSLAMIGVMTAVVFVGTYVVRIPFLSNSGYINFGDAFIYVCAYLLGPIAAIPAAIGSAFSDLAAGAAVYILPTALIKGVMGLVAGLLMRKGRNLLRYMLACIICGAIMTLGYFLVDLFLFGAVYATLSLPFNCIQWEIGIISAAIFPVVVKINRYLNAIK